MTKEEYIVKKNQLIELHKNQLKTLAAEYAFANNSIQLGDIITSDYGISIKVDQIKWTNNNFVTDSPCCIYFGPLYTKKGMPHKNGKRESLIQTRLITLTSKGEGKCPTK